MTRVDAARGPGALRRDAAEPAIEASRARPEGWRDLEAARARTVWQAVTQAAQGSLERLALVAADDGGDVRRLTYRQLLDRVSAVSAGLAGVGVRRGDRVVLWMTNTLEWIVSSLACMRLGAVVVPINPFLAPAEIGFLIAHAGARHLILIDRFREACFPEVLAQICPEFAAAPAPGMLFSAEYPELRNVILLARSGGQRAGAFDFAALEAAGADVGSQAARDLAEALERSTRPTDLAMIKYTSGSTGFPKGAMLEHGGLVANGLLHARRIGVRRTDVFFSMMPFFHGGGSIYGQMTMLLNGGTLVFTEAFDPALAVRLIDQEQATIELGVRSKEIVQAAMEQGRVLGSLRIAPRPNAAARRVMPNVIFCMSPFGLTETYGPVSMTSPQDAPEKQATTSGRLLEGYECRAIDPVTGADTAPGQPGEAWLRGNVMRGYWNRPDETARAIDADGWLHSEDLVTIDADGYLTWLGRLKLTLSLGGETVSIEEIERLVERCEGVGYCAAVGVPDDRSGDALRLYVTARPDGAVSETELRNWLMVRVAPARMPRDILIVNALPRLANGKLDRLKLTQWARTDTLS
ncbi:class I adenylate-forming enzyme family protein [Phenylobacterium sp. LjRoot225]|uniref:class I adenylate-forming enzyme family protein n=1 Tax=Phenylobacterium sp. LjRoot225 TaxID=3342285 RepID=UPI003ECF0900